MQPSEPSKFAQAGGSPLDALDCPSLTFERGGARIDLHGRRHPGGQDDALGHLIDMNTDRDALRQAHPGEDRVDIGETLPVGLCVCDVDATGDAVDMAVYNLTVAHQLDVGWIADAEPLEIGLLEIA